MHFPTLPTVRNSSLIASEAGARRPQLGCSKLGPPAFAPRHAGPPGCLHFQSPGVRAATHLHPAHLPGLTWSQSRLSVLDSQPSDSYSSQPPGRSPCHLPHPTQKLSWVHSEKVWSPRKNARSKNPQRRDLPGAAWPRFCALNAGGPEFNP